MNMNTQEKAELMRILIQKKELLSKMLEMTMQIKTELQQDRIDAFARAIGGRQTLITQIDALTRAEHDFNADDDLEVVALKKEIRGIVGQTLWQDEENTALAQDKLQKYREQIRHLNQTKKGVGHYARPIEPEDAFFVDANK